MVNIVDGKVVDYMTTEQAAALAGVSVRTVRGWTQSGKLPSFKKIEGCPQSPTLIWNRDIVNLVWERTKKEINRMERRRKKHG